MIIETIANLLSSMIMFIRGEPDQRRIEDNIKVLNSTVWFNTLYQQHKDIILKDDAIRELIGRTNVRKILSSERKAEAFHRKLRATINDR
ncbi:hypothetical protein QTG56_07340 [Rossellomorea sp. AcN35-11]|nr:hypothetical protein [Rossellomorea aquimaris]WJV30829.1 hypothetical protein QTG56_07340 [Rossellomorea sp. AcN35-11]